MAEAYLDVFAAGWGGPGADITAGAYAISRTLAIRQTTWLSPELGSTWYLPGANHVLLDRRPFAESTVTTAGPARWYRLDLTALVKQWLDGSTANNGVLLRCESCAGSPLPGYLCTNTFAFASSENSDPGRWPRLVVRYE